MAVSSTAGPTTSTGASVSATSQLTEATVQTPTVQPTEASASTCANDANSSGTSTVGTSNDKSENGPNDEASVVNTTHSVEVTEGQSQAQPSAIASTAGADDPTVQDTGALQAMLVGTTTAQKHVTFAQTHDTPCPNPEEPQYDQLQNVQYVMVTNDAYGLAAEPSSSNEDKSILASKEKMMESTAETESDIDAIISSISKSIETITV